MDNEKRRCCIITPIGPGHAGLYEECRASVQQAFNRSKGPFSEIIFYPADDSHGQYGRSQRRNEGISFAHSKGIEWIFFLDADDLMLETAFETVEPYIDAYDAVWGAICERLPGGGQRIRPNQVMPIHSIRGVLGNDPYFTLQMGHFIRTDAAFDQMFDVALDAGEDFKYYLGIWRDKRCIKLDKPLFVNRRGMHSTGPKSADGRMWRDAVSNVFLDFRIENAVEMLDFFNERSQYPNGRHIVVTGFSRSGSTMFYNMLRSSVLGFITPGQEMPAAAVIGNNTGNMMTKRPLDIFNVQEIYKANKYGKIIDFIIIIRDVRSVITSRHAAVPDDYFIGYDHQYFLYPNGKYEFSNPGVVATFQAVTQLVQGDLPGRKIVIRYEDLVRSTAEVQELLAKQLELRYRDRFDRFSNHEIPENLEIAMNDVSPPDPGRALKWKAPEHRMRIKQQFTECPRLFEILKATGYEKNDVWFKQYSGDV